MIYHSSHIILVQVQVQVHVHVNTAFKYAYAYVCVTVLTIAMVLTLPLYKACKLQSLLFDLESAVFSESHIAILCRT